MHKFAGTTLESRRCSSRWWPGTIWRRLTWCTALLAVFNKENPSTCDSNEVELVISDGVKSKSTRMDNVTLVVGARPRPGEFTFNDLFLFIVTLQCDLLSVAHWPWTGDTIDWLEAITNWSDICSLLFITSILLALRVWGTLAKIKRKTVRSNSAMIGALTVGRTDTRAPCCHNRANFHTVQNLHFGLQF